MSSHQLKGLFINPSQANCSIYESGIMMYNCLSLSNNYQIDYLEINSHKRRIPTDYDFYAFNYHFATMGWLDLKSLERLSGLKLTFVLEALRNDPFALCSSTAFDAYCVLDPTMNVSDKRVYTFPRPLETASLLPAFQEPEVPTIGSFGFATEGKGYELVVEAVGREFERALVHINIPLGTYTNEQYSEQLIARCHQSARPGIEVRISRDYLNKNQLIEWCSQNTLNCFLYNRDAPGLSATTDQAISSGRPLAISTNETFRHIHSRITPYPLRSLKDSILYSQSEVLQLQRDWQPEKFADQFEVVLNDLKISSGARDISTLPKQVVLRKINPLPVKIKSLLLRVAKDITPPLLLRTVKRFHNRGKSLLPSQLQTFIHPSLQSYSQFNEDLLIDLLLGSKKDGFYVDVGANDPVFNSNTQRFWLRGWSGINIEPGVSPYQKLCQARPRDINLNLGVGSTAGTLLFYDIEADPSLSSFDEQTAQNMATFYGLAVTPKPIKVQPLYDIFAEYADNRSLDFLSVDAEGIDLDVLQSNDWKYYRPTLVLVEMNNQPLPISRYMSGKSYLLIFNNNFNGLFVDLKTDDKHLQTLLKNYF